MINWKCSMIIKKEIKSVFDKLESNEEERSAV